MVDYVGRTLGPYKLEAALGKGGMATVYRAYQTSVKRYVAIKVMAPEIADQPGFVERFAREAEVIASLEHPHILPVIDYGDADGIHYLVMRYIEGGSLEDRMRRKPLSMQECSRMLSQIGSALDYAHKRGVIHRDMKPNNVLLDGSENCYLTDFGIARLTQSEQKLTATGSVMGTPAYMSPEQALGNPVDARSDLYALGVMLYEMVLNRLPFVGDTPAAMIFQHVYEQPTPPRTIKPDLPDSVIEVLNRAMAKAPDDRFQSAGELSDAFVEAISVRAAPSRTTPLPEATDRTVIGDMEGSQVPRTPTVPPRFPTPGLGTPHDAMPTQGAARPAAPAPSTVGGGELAPVPRRGPNVLLIGIAALVVILALAGGGYALISNNAAVANQTGTAVMLLALSATQTPTNTPPFTATATATATPPPTETPNATLTLVAVQMATISAMQAAQSTQTMNAMFQQTIDAALQATATGQARIAQATASAEAANATATAHARPTNTLTPTFTPTRRIPPTATPTPPKPATDTPVPPDNAAVQEQITQLVQNGVLSSASGSVVLTKDAVDVSAEKAGFNYWDRIDTNVTVADFVMSAAVTWDAPDTSNECGFLFRYTEPSDKPDNRTFYAVTITRTGDIRVIARDSGGYRDAAVFEQASNMIQVDDGATNEVMLIGQGKLFRLFVNGTKVADFSDAAYDSGNIGAFASRNEGSTRLTCNFSNLWVYSLTGLSLADSLMSKTPGDVVAGLESAGIIPQGAKLMVQTVSDSISVDATDQSISRYNTISRTQFKNFVFSTDVTSVGDQKALTVACGVFYDGQSVPDNLVAVYYQRDQSYGAYIRQNQAWLDSAISSGTSQAIKGGTSVTNRLTLVVIDGKITLFINGTQVFEATDTTLTSGLVGDYIEKGTQGGAEQCNYANTSVWRLN